MKFPRLLFFLLSLTSLVLSAAPSAVTKGAVTVELVAGQTAIQPGQPFWVALKMNHVEHWHSYWINPGTGYPTSLDWELPEGFTASPIIWPTPHVVKDSSGQVTGLGYENEVFLFTKITPSANLTAGTSVTLRAKAGWLMCKESCVPGETNLELSLPVGTPATNDDTERFAALQRELPQRNSPWTATATRDAKSITLRLTPTSGTTHRPTDLHFFDQDALLDYAAPQFVREENGGYLLTFTLSTETKPEIARLTGVLTSANGWSAGRSYGGIIIDAPFSPLAGRVIPNAPSGNLPPAPATLAGTLLLAFIGGLILNLMPCVFPVIGIKILGFVNQSGNDRKKVTLHGLVFASGVLLSFWMLAGVLLVLRAGGSQLGWGFQLQSPVFVFSMAVFMLIFALNMSGLFEVGLSATGVGGTLQMKDGYGGSFFTGALATLVATPCSAPFLAPALGAALSLSAVESLLIFTAIAIGLATPYLLLSIFPQAIKMLPRPGAWMETFKQFMAFPLYATVGWLLWVLAGQTKDDDNALLLIAFGFVLVAMATWVYGRFAQPHGKPSRQWFGRLAAAALFAAGLATGWPKSAPAETATGYQVTWEKWSPEAIAAGQKAGKFVYVDFTARWCATCQTNKAAIFHNDEVLAEFAQKNVLLLRADWTNKDAKITAELARWNRSAVPFNLIYAPGKTEPVVLPELLTPGKVLEALAAAAAK